jgi:hypothetical protein
MPIPDHRSTGGNAMSDRYQGWRAAFEDLHTTILKAQDERDKRRDLVGGQPGWVAYEIEAVCDRVNLLRARRGVGPVSLIEVARQESSAAGHVDYTQKLAIYAADLVMGP